MVRVKFWSTLMVGNDKEKLKYCKGKLRSFISCCQETGLEVKCEDTKHRSMRSREQKAEEPQHEQVLTFETVKKILIFWNNPNTPNRIHEEIKNRFVSGNICCNLVQNRLSCRLLSKSKGQKKQSLPCNRLRRTRSRVDV